MNERSSIREYPNLSKLLDKYGDIIISLYRQELLKKRVDDTGALGNSLDFIISSGEEEYNVELRLLDYWKYVEYGRESGSYPPINAIKNWIQTKPILPRVYNGKLPTTDQLTFLISRKIKDKGIKGKHILSDSLEILDTNYKELLEEAITKDLKQQVDNLFKKI